MKKIISGIVLILAASTLAQEKCYEFYPKGGNQKFKAVTSNAAEIAKVEAELKLSASERKKFITGKIQKGDGGHNQPWSWSFIKNEWGIYGATINDCVGEPNEVEKNVDAYMVEFNGRYCPWGGQVIGECTAGSSALPLAPETSADFRLESLGGLENIGFTIPRAGTVSLELLRIDGTPEGRLDLGRRMAGTITTSWKGLHPAPGVYHLVLGLDEKNVSVKTITLP